MESDDDAPQSTSSSGLQVPPLGPFNSEDLKWSKVGGDDQAIIPISRLQDFMTGEGNRPVTMCSFTKGSVYKCKGKSGRSTQWYHCVYGPDDNRHMKDPNWMNLTQRTPGATGPGSRPRANKTMQGTSNPRGCQCRFSVIYNAKFSTDCTIRWKQREHTDRNGLICHGLHDPTAGHGNAVMSPHL